VELVRRAIAQVSIVFCVVLLFALILLSFGPLPEWILTLNHNDYSSLSLSDKLTAEKDIRSLLLQGLAGILLIAGAVATWRQVTMASAQLRLNRSVKVTDAFTAALEQLGATSLAQRVGGVYALDRVACDDQNEAKSVVEVLAAFVRQPRGQLMEEVPADVQAAVYVLLRWCKGRPINLNGARLREVDLSGLNLRGVSLRNAVLVKADLRGADLSDSDLKDADLRDANLTGAKLPRVGQP
jgi:hypothetical protein